MADHNRQHRKEHQMNIEAGMSECPRTRRGAALDVIAEMLRDPEWGVGMLEDIADLVRGTGRSVENYPDNRATWERH
jgi:hypothetical protein